MSEDTPARVKHRMTALVKIRGLRPIWFRKSSSKVRLSTTEGLQSFSIPASDIVDGRVRMRVASFSANHVTCVLPGPGRRLVAFKASQVQVEED